MYRERCDHNDDMVLAAGDSYVFRRESPDYPLYDTSMFPDKDLQMKIHRLPVSAMQYHAHTYLQMSYVCKGRCRHFVENYSYDIHKGDLVVIPPPYLPLLRQNQQ
ncbi:MAG: AraC family ligand binding domain-containing protein [Paenibacillaceae bacterium]|nr:AraC family ligand binding domain-containing protein [Paenibacillaceae bacterium]